jgi:cobyrinic acid a,c-diamide synthase
MNRLWESARRGLVHHNQSFPGVWRGVIFGTMIFVMASVRVGIAMADERPAILAVLQAYMAAVYARDYATAYQWISEADRRQKSFAHYKQDNQPFKGASLVLAQRLAREMVIQEAVVDLQGERATVRTTLSLPHGNAEEVSRLLLAPGGFEEAPRDELEERMARLEALIASGQLPRLEVEDTWTLVRDPTGWRILLGGETP